jgi:hypothetical protein
MFSFRSLSPQRYYTFNSNLTYGYDKAMRRSSSNLVMVPWFFLQKYASFHFEKRKFSICIIISPIVVHIQFKFNAWICHKNTMVIFEFGHDLMIADRVIPLELLKNSEFFNYRSLSPQWCSHLNQIWHIDTS